SSRIGDSPAALRKRLPRHIAGTDLYDRFAGHGLLYGPAFRGVIETCSGPQEALGLIAAPPAIKRDLANYRLHPALLDACLQIALAAIPETASEAKTVFVPSSVKRIRFYGGGADVAWSHVRLTQIGARSILANYTVFDADGAVIVELDGMRLRRLDLASDEL